MWQVKWCFYNAFYADETILHFNKDSGDVTVCCDETGILSAGINYTNFDNNFDEDDPDTIRIFAGHIRFKKRKAPE